MARSKQLLVLFILGGLQLQASCLAAGNELASKLLARATVENSDVKTRPAALHHIDQALELEPKNSEYWWVKALILVSMDEHEAALPCVNKSLEMDSKSPSAWKVKAIILNGLGKNDEALAAIDKAIQIAPVLAFRLVKADILSHMQKFVQAEKEMDYVLKLEPKNTQARGRRAVAARHTNDWDKAIEDLSFLINDGHQRILSYSVNLQARAEAYTATKQYDKAIADYKAGLKLSPDNRELHNGLQQIYKITGNKKEAQAESKVLENLDKDFRPFK